MNKIMLLLSLCTLGAGGALGQTSETIRVKSGETFPENEKYRYAKFTPGFVEYHNGRAPSQALLNYNMLLREMQFLNNRDTMSIADTPAIRRIRIGDDEFVYDQNGLVMTVLGHYGTVTLAVDHSLKLANVDKEGGFGMSSGASSIKSYSSYPTNAGTRAKLEVRGDVVYSHQRILTLINKNNLVFPASRKGILKVYPKKKSEIDNYLKDNPIQFGDVADVKKLLEYCQALD